MSQRLSTIQHLPPLPRRAIPQPWEDLASIISRTSRLMGYERPEWILHFEFSSHSIASNQLAYLGRLADYELLEQLLLIDEDELYSFTLHRFIPSLGGAYSSTGQLHTQVGRPHISDQKLFWPQLETQVCPICLSEGECYDRLYWRIRALLICPQHFTYLQQRCTICFKPIPALRSHSFQCPYCRVGDYRTAYEPIHPRDTWLYDTQLLLLEHLGVNRSEWQCGLSSQSLLMKLHTWHYFLILSKFEYLFVRESFVSVVLPDLIQNPELNSPGLRLGERKSAFLFQWIVAEWPNHFLWLLERIASVEGAKGPQG